MRPRAEGPLAYRRNKVPAVARIDFRDRALLRAPSDARGIFAYLGWVLLVALAYAVFAKVGFAFAFSVQQVTAVWPPAGIALAGLILGGYRLWPGIFIGAFVANVVSNEPVVTAGAIAAGNTLGPLIGSYLLRRFHFDPSFARVRDALVFVVFAAIVAMTITATNGVTQLLLAHLVPPPQAGRVWLLWWIGDASGVLIVAPFLLTWRNVLRDGLVQGEAGPLELVILVVALMVVGVAGIFTHFPTVFPLYPFVVWAALRAGARFTTAGTLTICAFAVWGTVHGFGPFTHGRLEFRLMALVTFTGVLSIAGLVMCALTAERRSALARMQAAEQRFKVLAEELPQIVWTADASGTIDWFNQRWQQFTGNERIRDGNHRLAGASGSR